MKNKTFTNFIGAAGFSLAAVPSFAATQEKGILEWLVNNSLLVITFFILALVLRAFYSMMQMFIDIQKQKLNIPIESDARVTKVPEVSIQDRLWQMLTNYVPKEKEADLDLGHDYDGIRELDNSLPPWWLYTFYLTTVFAFAYTFWIHFTDYSPTIEKEYANDMEQGELQKLAFLSAQADVVNETNVTYLEDEKSLNEGKELFVRNCIACHLETGGGSVGPNLTDEYWIHGGGIKNVFTVIKNGVPEKGMIAWKAQLRPSQMQRVASYVLSLQGSNPPGAKAPEGVVYKPEEEAPQE